MDTLENSEPSSTFGNFAYVSHSSCPGNSKAKNQELCGQKFYMTFMTLHDILNQSWKFHFVFN